MRPSAASVLAVLGALLALAPARAQTENPVYVDDSTAAQSTLDSLGQLIAAGNQGEAVRALQALLDDEPDRLLVAPGDPMLFTGVRHRIHEALLSNPALLEAYRERIGPSAQSQLDAGDFRAVERSRLLTAAGFEAALRLAQWQMESGQFDAAARTLAQLEKHPDRIPRDGAVAAELLLTIARYIPEPEVVARAQRWLEEAGDAAGPAPDPVEWPTGAGRRGVSPWSAAPPLNTGAFETAPLWTEPLDQGFRLISPAEAERIVGLGRWLFPAATDDYIIFNDGVSISARDRVTLREVWRRTPRPPQWVGVYEPNELLKATRLSEQADRIVHEPVSVTVHEDLVLAVTGVTNSRNDRDGDPSVHAIRLKDGAGVWSTLLQRDLPGMTLANTTGQIVVESGVAVVGLLKASQAGRLTTFYLAGLDVAAGDILWTRSVGSAARLTMRGASVAPGVGAGHRGIVYWGDALGALGAVEAATGRPLWVRRMPWPETVRSGQSDFPWEAAGPVVIGEWIFYAPPSTGEILKIDRETGELLGAEDGRGFGQPRYLVAVGDHIAAVGRDRAVFFDPDAFPGAPPRLGPSLGGNGEPGIYGRAIAVGDHLMLPTRTGAALVDPQRPQQNVERLDLSAPGSLLPLGEQLVALDGLNMHSYMTWQTADDALARRIEQRPEDPTPLVHAVRLAHRGDRPERIPAAVDEALRRMNAQATGAAATQRQRLFTLLLEVVSSAQAQAASDAGWAPAPIEPRLLEEIIVRLGRAAETDSERLAYALAMGRLRETQGRVADALEIYHQWILADPAIAGAAPASRESTRGEVEAAGRIRAMLLDHGYRVYEAFDAVAAAELAHLEPDAESPELEALIRRYPASAASIEAIGRLADRARAGGRSLAETGYLLQARSIAELIHDTGSPTVTADDIGAIAGRLINSLVCEERFVSAAGALDRFTARYPRGTLSDRGETIDPSFLAGQIAEQLRAGVRLPRIGDTIAGAAQALANWTLMPALDDGAAPEHVMMLSDARAEVALWSASVGARSGADSALLQERWSRAFRDHLAPTLLRFDADTVDLFWPGAPGSSIERIDAVSGETRWETQSFHDLFEEDGARERLFDDNGRPRVLQVPRAGPRRRLASSVDLIDLIADGDALRLCLVERAGRIAMFSAEDGATIWNHVSPLRAVVDADLGEGVIAVVGYEESPDLSGQVAANGASILIYDAESGRLGATLEVDDVVRWIRIAPGGVLLVGAHADVRAYDASSGEMLWNNVDLPRGTDAAWVAGERLLVYGDSHLWHGDLVTGAFAREAVPDRDKLLWRVPHAVWRHGRRIVITSASGAIMLDERGEVQSMDAVGAEDNVIPPVPAEGRFVTIEYQPADSSGPLPRYPLHLLDDESLRLMQTIHVPLGARPTDLAIVDGAVIITAGSVTVALPAPPE
jgi:outer membrane protein assembly factor BamB